MSVAIHERPVLREAVEGLRHHFRFPALGRRGLAATELSSNMPSASFSGLRELAREFHPDDPSTAVLRPAIDDTADLLLHEIKDASSPDGIPKKAISQNELWDALTVWDQARSAKTRELATYALDHATALSGHAALNSAFHTAMENGKPFEVELDRYNGYFIDK